jgi:hypothetical protein
MTNDRMLRRGDLAILRNTHVTYPLGHGKSLRPFSQQFIVLQDGGLQLKIMTQEGWIAYICVRMWSDFTIIQREGEGLHEVA